MKLQSALASLLIVNTISASYVCNSQTVTTTQLTNKADFMFLIDASGSMCDKIKGVVSGLKKFANKIQSSKIDARYGLVTFGGLPELKLQFTDNHGKLISNLEAIDCTAGGQEASFEAMRMLFTNNGADLTKSCDKTVKSDCKVTWRSDATKVLLHATDEDSDLPLLAKYRAQDQTQASSFCTLFYNTNDQGCYYGNNYRMEPSFYPSGLTNVIYKQNNKYYQSPYFRNSYRTGNNLYLGQGYENEIELTAKILSDNGVIVNSLVGLVAGTEDQVDAIGLYNPISSFSQAGSFYFGAANNKQSPFKEDTLTIATYQFGHPNNQVQDPQTFQNFNANATLKQLNQLGMGNSLQARILKSSGFMRVFDIDNFAGAKKSTIIDAFYDQLLQTTSYVQQNCVFVPDPTTSVSVAPSTSSSSVRPSTSSSVVPTTSSSSVAPTTSSSSSVTPTTSSSSSIVPTITTFSSVASSTSSSIEVSSSTSSSIEVSSSSVAPSTSSSIEVSSSSSSSIEVSSSSSQVVQTPEATTSELGQPTTTSVYGQPTTSSVYGADPVQTTTSESQQTPAITQATTSSSTEVAISEATTSSSSTQETSEALTSSSSTEETVATSSSTQETVATTSVSSSSSQSQPAVTQTTSEDLIPTGVPIIGIIIDEPTTDDSTTTEPEENDSPVFVDVVPAKIQQLIAPFLAKSNKGSAASTNGTTSSVKPQPLASIYVEVVSDSPQSNQQQEQANISSPQGVATVTILAPVAAVASAFGLFMLRRSRAVARDIKFAFGSDATSAATNPLYASQFQAHENPLFMNETGAELQNKDMMV